jgi:hypothetical protein
MIAGDDADEDADDQKLHSSASFWMIGMRAT